MITAQDVGLAKQALGAQPAALRHAAGVNQHAFAKLVHTSRSSIANIERGRQVSTRDFWQRCDVVLRAHGSLIRNYDELQELQARRHREAADALSAYREVDNDGIPVAALNGVPEQSLNEALVVVLEGLRSALTVYRPVTGPVGTGRRFPAVLTATIELHEAYQRADYGAAARALPTLLDDVNALVLVTSGTRRVRVLQTQAMAYIAASKLASKVGDGQLAWLAADRAASSAQLSNGAALTAVAAYQAAGALLLLPGKAAEAETVAVAAAEDIGPAAAQADAELLSARGSLLLLAALTAGRRNDGPAARMYLNEAAALAEQLGGDGNRLWTAFGPTNVAVHEVSTAVALGRPDDAIRIGEVLDTSRLPGPLVGRRTQVHLDLAAANAQRPDGDAMAVLHMLEAERVAPQTVYVNARARTLLTTMLARERRVVTPGLRPLAERAGVAA
jgi:transcriptional regulator with XRE-family HTH domain